VNATAAATGFVDPSSFYSVSIDGTWKPLGEPPKPTSIFAPWTRLARDMPYNLKTWAIKHCRDFIG
jgi:hypothetical protein